MIGPYIQAVETRMNWLKWANNGGGKRLQKIGYSDNHLKGYLEVLSTADTYYVDAHFSRLINSAAQGIPDSAQFDCRALQSPRGWLYIEEPFYLPPTVFGWKTYEPTESRISIRNIGWTAVEGGTQFYAESSNADFNRDHSKYLAKAGAVPFTEGFFLWSAIPLQDGAVLGESIKIVEDAKRGAPEKVYLEGGHGIHELRWIYAAFHLMAQRLALTIRQKVDRSVRRRAEKRGEKAPEVIKVITLRRMEEARKRESPHNVEWHWQWEVRGHWRNQFYPSENTHKPVFVESYIKGPTDKPFKSPGLKLFAAVR